MADFKKPSMKIAILITVAALFDLAGAFFMVASNPESGTLAMFIFAELFLIAIAIYQWVIYAKQYINFAMEQKLKENNKEV